jgi:excisionase family DNA binding protein
MASVLKGEARLMSEPGLAKYLGLGLTTVQRMKRDGNMPPHVVVGRRRRYRESTVLAWLAAREKEGASDAD